MLKTEGSFLSMEVSEEALLQQQISLFLMTSGLSLSMTRTGRTGPVPPPNLPHQTSTKRTENKNIFKKETLELVN